MVKTAGSLSNTTVISIRTDLLTAQLLKQQAKAAKLNTQAYAQRILMNHVHHVDIGQEIKSDVEATLRYARSAYAEISYLKDEISAMKEKIRLLEEEKCK